jgi:hypothetical protein
MNLKKELKIINKIDIPAREWLISAHSLFRKHQFKTNTSIIERNETKIENIRKIEERIRELGVGS